jgi:hypothetical protein
MDENVDTSVTQSDFDQESTPMLMAEFLESVSPGKNVLVSNLVRREAWVISTPEIRLHCSQISCDGTQFFRFFASRKLLLDKNVENLIYLTYRCSNCQRSSKIFSIIALPTATVSGTCYKIGERPLYGPPTPPKLVSLIGPDRELFLKGRLCENQGLGIGAFAYYRRIVENQKDRILREILKVCEKLNADSQLRNMLKSAIAETQFSKALASVKGALPQCLLINGHNPLILLHSALSKRLHEQTDESCLEISHSVRVILGELAERLDKALKDEAELNTALSRLMQKK